MTISGIEWTLCKVLWSVIARLSCGANTLYALVQQEKSSFSKSDMKLGKVCGRGGRGYFKAKCCIELFILITATGKIKYVWRRLVPLTWWLYQTWCTFFCCGGLCQRGVTETTWVWLRDVKWHRGYAAENQNRASGSSSCDRLRDKHMDTFAGRLIPHAKFMFQL